MIASRKSLPLCLMLLLTAGCQKGPTGVPKSLQVVRTEPVLESTAFSQNRYAAVVRANAQVELDFKVGGYVRHISRSKAVPSRIIQEGDRVTSGATLAVIDTSDYSAHVQTASAAVLEATAAALQAERDQVRTRALVSTGTLTPVELENRSSQRDVSDARVARAKAALNEARLALADTTLRAPFSGVILSRTVEQGAFVTPRTPGFVIADDSRMKIAFGVPDTLLPSLHAGDAATVEVPSLNRSFAASVSRIASAADPRSRVFEVEVIIPNQEQVLKVGLGATVVLDPSAAQQKGFRVPLRALVRGAQPNSDVAVYTVETANGRTVVHARDLQVLRVVGDDALVLGLKPDQNIVTLGASLLHDGDTVQLAP
jgi:membrane fusion protein, multidrug efflux system